MNNSEWKEVIGEIFDFEKPGDSLEGKLMAVRKATTGYESTLYDIQTSQGKGVSIWGSSVLNSKLGRVQIGETIKIVYKGKTRSKKSGRDYDDYSVYIKGNAVRATASDPEPPVTDREEI